MKNVDVGSYFGLSYMIKAKKEKKIKFKWNSKRTSPRLVKSNLHSLKRWCTHLLYGCFIHLPLKVLQNLLFPDILFFTNWILVNSIKKRSQAQLLFIFGQHLLTYYKAQYLEAIYEWKAHEEYQHHHIHLGSMLACSHTSTALSTGWSSLPAFADSRNKSKD